jgi:hypothetical protein
VRLRKLTAFAIWAAVSLVVMTVITLPISLQTHLIAGAAVVAAMMILPVGFALAGPLGDRVFEALAAAGHEGATRALYIIKDATSPWWSKERRP